MGRLTDRPADIQMDRLTDRSTDRPRPSPSQGPSPSTRPRPRPSPRPRLIFLSAYTLSASNTELDTALC